MARVSSLFKSTTSAVVWLCFSSRALQQSTTTSVRFKSAYPLGLSQLPQPPRRHHHQSPFPVLVRMMSSTADDNMESQNLRPKRGVKGVGMAKTLNAVDVAKRTTKSRLAKKKKANQEEEAAVNDDFDDKSKSQTINKTTDSNAAAVAEVKKKPRGRPSKKKLDLEESTVNMTKSKTNMNLDTVNDDRTMADLDDTVHTDDETVHAGRRRTKKVGAPVVEPTAAAKDDSKKKKARLTKKKKMDVEESAVNDDDVNGDDEKKPKRRPVKKKAATEESSDASPLKKVRSSDSPTPTKAKRAKSPDHQRLTERDELPKLWDSEKDKDTSYSFKIASWNVAGIRALLRNNPDTLPKLCKDHNLDVLCLQETKLQESHLDDPKLKIRQVLEEDYDSYWSCSTAKKGYSGTAVFVKRRGRGAEKGVKKQATLDGFFGTKKKDDKKADDDIDADLVKNLIPTEVSYKMGVDAHDQEGRLIHVDYPLFSFTNVYVPNSGQKLERLDYRTEQWDKDLVSFVKSKGPKPTFWLGDLNVAHTNLEVWNDGAKHLAKQAGVTVQERQSFTQQLQETGFQDAFRALHPDAKGCYTYWSQRAGNREPNKGLRLDYFCCSSNLFDASEKVVARDSYILYDVHGSDHCPVVLELEIKK